MNITYHVDGVVTSRDIYDAALHHATSIHTNTVKLECGQTIQHRVAILSSQMRDLFNRQYLH